MQKKPRSPRRKTDAEGVASGPATPKISRANKAKIFAVIGASGAGKTTYVMREIKRDNPARLLIWDTKGEFSEEGYAKRVRSISELVAAIRGGESWQIAMVPYGSPAQVKKLFDLFTQAAFHAGRCTVIAEELSDVCDGGVCNSAGWRKCIMQGRTQGLTIYALTQRPAAIDKNTLGNASLTRCGRLQWESDARVMRNCLRVPESELLEMQPFEWVERTDMGEIRRGKLEPD